MKYLILVFSLVISVTIGRAQSFKDSIESVLEGYWEGAIIRGNSSQKLTLEFLRDEKGLYVVKNNEEINPIWGRSEYNLDLDSTGLLRLFTMHGEAQLRLDINNLELLGSISKRNPSFYLHLKKRPSPPKTFRIEEINVLSGDVKIAGHLHLPNNKKVKSALIYVRGRGCVNVPSINNLTAKYLREYGIAVLIYHKRGLQDSEGNCENATLEELASDLLALKKFLDHHEASFSHIGVIGSSAGAWVMAKAQETAAFDFMISMVGPSTSVYEQQIQSLKYAVKEYNLSEDSKAKLYTYTDLLFSAKANEENYNRLMSLLEDGKRQNWMEILDETDIPSSIAGIDSVWVRKHDYDPKDVLRNFNKPFLGIFGDKDWVVPYKENIARLEELFTGDRRNLLNTAVAYNTGHGLFTSPGNVNISGDVSYWHFVRASPIIKLEIIAFLRKYGFIEL